MASLALAFDILARDKGATRTFDKVGDSAERAGKKGSGFGGSIAKLVGPIGLGVGAVELAGAAFEKFTEFMGDAVEEARESEKVNKTTAQIIKSTGGVAKVSADQVGDLATAISNKTGVDDEAIQSGSNLLLTFKNVRNEAGKGADIFDRATQAATDLSAAGFGSIEGSSKMLGKALNDPVKGISALGRAGVTFSEDQKKAIKKMVETGDVLGAQKIILGEVESQVGGVAEASSTMGEKVTTSWNNFKESVGAKLLPVLDRLGKWFLDKGLPALQEFGGWIEDHLWPALQKGYETIMPGVQEALDILGGKTGDGTSALKDFGTALTDYVIPFLSELFRYYLPAAAGQLKLVIETTKRGWQTFITFRDVIARVAAFILEKFADITQTGAGMLRALSKVPGFGWAKDAADKLENASSKARTLGRNIAAIPSNKNVTVSLTTRALPGRLRVGNQWVNVGMRATGGPVTAGKPYAVGDNPDGSWNKTTELFVPSQSGRILNQSQIAAATAGAGPSAAASAQRLHPHDIAAIVAGFAAARPTAVISPEAIDLAMGRML